MDALVQEAIEYIQEVSSLHRPNRNIAKNILELNKIINRLDIEKDAKAGKIDNEKKIIKETVVETKPPYTTAMEQLFPGISAINHLKKLDNIEQDIVHDTELGPEGNNRSWLKKPGKGYIPFVVEEDVVNAYHDSGYNPKEIKEDFLTWITPGSFIDPAGRAKPYMDGTDKFPATGDITIPLDVFGFAHGTSFKATMLPANECRVEITIPGAGVVNIRSTPEFESMDLPDYFCGNPIKNIAINNEANTRAGISEIKKYVISKELSDFSQILFAIINMIRLRGEQELYTHCMFTTDKVVAARCRLMGLQCCVQDHEKTGDKTSHKVIVFGVKKSDKEKRVSKLNVILTNNRIVKKHINTAMLQGFHIVPGEVKYVEGGQGNIRTYFQEILESIDTATSLVEALPLEGPGALPPLIYEKEIEKYRANTPINENGRIIKSLQRLFVNCPELREVDAIHIGGDTFGVVIDHFIKKREESERIASIVPRGSRVSRGKTRKFLKLRKMKGGVRESGQTGPWDGSVVANIPGSLLHHMRIILALDDTPENNALFEDFIFRAYNHLIYICETPLDYRLIYIYMNINRIENSTLDAFYTEYMGYDTNPEVLQFAASVRDRLAITTAAAAAYDPMQMLAPSELVLDEAVNNKLGANAVNLPRSANTPSVVNAPNAVLNVPPPVNAPNAVLNNVATVVNAPNAVLNNAYATNTENQIKYAKTNLFMKHKNPAVKPRPFLRRSAYSKTRPLYNKNTSQYFKSMTGLTPRGMHVARKTRKRKNSTFKK